MLPYIAYMDPMGHEDPEFLGDKKSQSILLNKRPDWVHCSLLFAEL